MGEGCTGGPGSSNPDADRIPTQAPEPDDGNLTAKYLTRTPCGTVTLFSIPCLCPQTEDCSFLSLTLTLQNPQHHHNLPVSSGLRLTSQIRLRPLVLQLCGVAQSVTFSPRRLPAPRSEMSEGLEWF